MPYLAYDKIQTHGHHICILPFNHLKAYPKILATIEDTPFVDENEGEMGGNWTYSFLLRGIGVAPKDIINPRK